MGTPIDTEKYAPSGQPAQVPSIPTPTSGSVESILSKVKAILDLREGRSGSKYEQVVTWRDLYNVGLVAHGASGSWNVAAADGVVRGTTLFSSIPMLRDRLDEEIRNSEAYKRLMAQINSDGDTAGMPPEVVSELRNDILEEARTRGSAIKDLERVIQTAERSFAMRVSEVTAAVQDAQAGVKQVTYASATQNAATAGQITTVKARLDNFGGGGVTVEQKMTATVDRLNGMSGVYSVKIDAGGKFAGFQLSVDAPIGVTPYSAFLINADKFAIYTSGGNVSPFGADASGVYINGTVRINSGGATLNSLSSATSLNFIGTFSADPSTTNPENSVYKNSVNGNTYVLKSGSWVSFIPAGTNGTNGINGSNGARGSMTFYASGSSWSDTTANNTVTTITGSATKIIGDTVTISTSTFAATKYWNGTSWIDPGVIINGNLLVNGSITGTQISSSYVYAGAINTSQLTAGSTSDGRGSVSLLGFNSVLQVTRSIGTVLSGIYYNDTSGASAPALTMQSNCTGAVAFQFSGSATLPFLVSSSNSSYTAATFQNTALGKQISLGGSYCAYSPSGGGKIYILDGNGPFTGFHDGLISKDVQTDVGDIVVVESILYKHDVSNTLAKVTVSSKPYQKTAYGVVSDRGAPDNHLEVPYELWWDLIHDHELVTVNGIGEGQINVCGENGDIEAGDYIVTSSMLGKGMRQDDDILRSCTVAKATESVKFAYPAEVKMIACVYVAS